MSKILIITAAKPNPAGKDKAGNVPKAEQLLAEWVDIQNNGTEAILFSSISLTHTLFDASCRSNGRTENYWSNGADSLLTGQTARIRTGCYADRQLINPNDDQGNSWNCFANCDNFVLNNRCGDVLTVFWTDSLGNRRSDTVSYDANPPEGAVLKRSNNNKLALVNAYYR